MKKTMLVLLSVLLVAACVLTFTACQENCDKLGHDWGEWSVKTDATCTAAGERVRTCNRCGEVGSEAIEALGHDWGAAVVVPATCGVAGKSTRECSRCDATDVETIPATENHTWVDDAESAKNKEATCTEAGVQAQKCSVCGATREVATELAAHDLSGELIPAEAPDCGHDGVLAHKVCANCQQNFDEEGNLLESIVDPATGDHQWEEDADSQENVEATCGAGGVQAYKCSVCEATKTEETDPTGLHQWIDDEDASRAGEKVEPSCAPGVQPTKCSECGALSTKKLDPTGAHVFDPDEVSGGFEATCGAEGRKDAKQCVNCHLYCDEAGELIGEGKEEDLVIPATGLHQLHDVEEGKIEATCGAAGVQPKACDNCDYTTTEEIPATNLHTFDKYEAVASTFTHMVYCSVCGAAENEAAVACTGNWTYAEEGHSRSCSLCGNSETADHTWKTTGGTYNTGLGTHTVACTTTSCPGRNVAECNNKTTGTCSVCKHVYVPTRQLIIVGQTHGTSWSTTTSNPDLIFTYDHENATYTLRITFASLDVFKIKSNEANWNGVNLGGSALATSRITFADSIQNPPSDLFTLADNITVKYECTVLLSVNSACTQISAYVEEVTLAEIEEYEFTFHVFNTANWSKVYLYAWASDSVPGDLASSNWPGTLMEADPDTGAKWFKLTLKSYNDIEGKKQAFILNQGNDTGKQSFENGKEITLAKDMYFNNTSTTQFSSAEEVDSSLAASATVAAQVAVLPVISKFDLAA